MVHERTGGVWTSEAVPGSAPFADVRLAVSAQGVPHLVHRRLFNSFSPDDPRSAAHPLYSTRLDGVWTTEDVDPTANANGFDAGIALDPEGSPHLAYVLGWRHTALNAAPTPLKETLNDGLRYSVPVASLLGG